jgi:hypothetical protein
MYRRMLGARGIARALLAAAAASFALGGAAQASAIVTLPGALSYEYFGFNFAINVQTSTSVGTLDYSGGPGCGGVCTATTALGHSPSVALKANEVVFEATGGGFAEAELTYAVEYLNTPGTYTVALHANDNLSAMPSPAQGQAYIAFGPAGPSPGTFQAIDFQDTDCVNGCQTGVANYTAPAPIPAVTSLQMVANTPYLLQMWVTISPGDTAVPLSASVDPTFSTSATGGRFIFSPGISGVPEPAAWALMLVGLAGLGAALRSRTRLAAA